MIFRNKFQTVPGKLQRWLDPLQTPWTIHPLPPPVVRIVTTRRLNILRSQIQPRFPSTSSRKVGHALLKFCIKTIYKIQGKVQRRVSWSPMSASSSLRTIPQETSRPGGTPVPPKTPMDVLLEPPSRGRSTLARMGSSTSRTPWWRYPHQK